MPTEANSHAAVPSVELSKPLRTAPGLKKRIRCVATRLGTRFVGGCVRLIARTIRIQTEDEHHFSETSGGKILCLWHGRALVATSHYRNTGMVVMISLSRDGEMLDRIFSTLGYRAIRGSSGPSGARALAECIRALRRGENLAITPDGPRGPSGIVQGGVIAMARRSGCPIVPVAASSRPRFLMKSWDRYMIPIPFSKARLLYGEPLKIPAEADDEEVEMLRQRLETQLRDLQDRADRDLLQPTFAESRSARRIS